MIDLYKPLKDPEADRLRNQIAAVQNLMVQLERSEKPHDVSLRALLRIDVMRRWDELSRLVQGFKFGGFHEAH